MLQVAFLATQKSKINFKGFFLSNQNHIQHSEKTNFELEPFSARCQISKRVGIEKEMMFRNEIKTMAIVRGQIQALDV